MRIKRLLYHLSTSSESVSVTCASSPPLLLPPVPYHPPSRPLHSLTEESDSSLSASLLQTKRASVERTASRLVRGRPGRRACTRSRPPTILVIPHKTRTIRAKSYFVTICPELSSRCSAIVFHGLNYPSPPRPSLPITIPGNRRPLSA